MRVALGLIVFLVGLVIVTPFVDGTTDGVYGRQR
jgi:hypothetical protein